MGEKSAAFRRQYEDALRNLESEDTEQFVLVSGDAAGECSVVFGDNDTVEKPQDHVDLLAAGVVAMSAVGDGSQADVLDELEARLDVER